MGNLTLAQQDADDGMVVGQLNQAPLPKDVSAAVAQVCKMDRAAA